MYGLDGTTTRYGMAWMTAPVLSTAIGATGTIRSISCQRSVNPLRKYRNIVIQIVAPLATRAREPNSTTRSIRSPCSCIERGAGNASESDRQLVRRP